MSTIFENLKKYSALRAIIFIILGAAILYNPLFVIKWLFYIIAAYFALMGIISIITAIANRKENGLATFEFVSGIILLLLGICIAVFAVQISLFIHVVMGILVIISGILFFTMGVDIQKAKIKSGVPLLIFAVAIIAAGAMVIVNPFGTQALLFRIFACILIVIGVAEVVTLIVYRKSNNRKEG